MQTSDREEKQMIYMQVTAEMTREQVAELVLDKVGLKKEDSIGKNAVKDNEMKLLDGYYRAHDCWFSYFDVSDGGNTVKCKDMYDMYEYDESAEYGDFGECLTIIHLVVVFSLFQVRQVRRWQSLLAESVDTTSSSASASRLEMWMKMAS